jgi:hypothetical protein
MTACSAANLRRAALLIAEIARNRRNREKETDRKSLTTEADSRRGKPE